MFNHRYFRLFIAFIMGIFFILLYMHFIQKLYELKHLQLIEKKARVDLNTLNNQEHLSALHKIGCIPFL